MEYTNWSWLAAFVKLILVARILKRSLCSGSVFSLVYVVMTSIFSLSLSQAPKRLITWIITFLISKFYFKKKVFWGFDRTFFASLGFADNFIVQLMWVFFIAFLIFRSLLVEVVIINGISLASLIFRPLLQGKRDWFAILAFLAFWSM